MDAIFVPLAGAVGASLDQVKLITCLLVAFPLGSVFVRVPSSRPNLRHLFNIGVTLFFLLPVLQIYTAFLQLTAGILATYFIAKYDRSARMPWIVFVFAMGHLMVNHVIRAMNKSSYETVEVTGPQMVLTMKLTTFAWNVWDGRRPAADLDKWQAAKRISTFPTLLEFLGYAYYFPGVLVGPYLEYADYKELIHETLYDGHDVKGNNKGRKLPSGRKRIAYRKMVTGLAFLGIFVVFGGKYNYTVVLTDWFAEQSILYRILLLQGFGFLERTKYYAIWSLTEGASILTGLGFTGYTSSGASLWTGAANLDILNIEFAPNFKVLLDSWNMKANVWLRECIYKRVTAKGKKPGFSSSMLTFATSAIWHGVAPGYYLTFFFGGFITSAGRLARTTIRPLVLPAAGEPTSGAKRVYDLLGHLTTTLLLNYSTTPFMLGTFAASLTSWARVSFYGHVIVLGGLAFFYLGGSRFLKGLQASKAKAANAKAAAYESGTSTPIQEKVFTVPPSFDRQFPPQK